MGKKKKQKSGEGLQLKHRVVSRIHKIFPPHILHVISRAVTTPTFRADSTYQIRELILGVMREEGIEYRMLAPGSNRLGLRIDGYVFKMALDEQGIIDNYMEFLNCGLLGANVARTYETNGLIAVQEEVTPMKRDQFVMNKEGMATILRAYANDFLLCDVGLIEKNYINWGFRANGDLCILDYGYVLPVNHHYMECDKCKSTNAKKYKNPNYTGDALSGPEYMLDVPRLVYTEDFSRLECPVCGHIVETSDVATAKLQRERDSYIQTHLAGIDFTTVPLIEEVESEKQKVKRLKKEAKEEEKRRNKKAKKQKEKDDVKKLYNDFLSPEEEEEERQRIMFESYEMMTNPDSIPEIQERIEEDIRNKLPEFIEEKKISPKKKKKEEKRKKKLAKEEQKRHKKNWYSDWESNWEDETDRVIQEEIEAMKALSEPPEEDEIIEHQEEILIEDSDIDEIDEPELEEETDDDLDKDEESEDDDYEEIGDEEIPVDMLHTKSYTGHEILDLLTNPSKIYGETSSEESKVEKKKPKKKNKKDKKKSKQLSYLSSGFTQGTYEDLLNMGNEHCLISKLEREEELKRRKELGIEEPEIEVTPREDDRITIEDAKLLDMDYHSLNDDDKMKVNMIRDDLSMGRNPYSDPNIPLTRIVDMVEYTDAEIDSFSDDTEPKTAQEELDDVERRLAAASTKLMDAIEEERVKFMIDNGLEPYSELDEDIHALASKGVLDAIFNHVFEQIADEEETSRAEEEADLFISQIEEDLENAEPLPQELADALYVEIPDDDDDEDEIDLQAMIRHERERAKAALVNRWEDQPPMEDVDESIYEDMPLESTFDDSLVETERQISTIASVEAQDTGKSDGDGLLLEPVSEISPLVDSDANESTGPRTADEVLERYRQPESRIVKKAPPEEPKEIVVSMPGTMVMEVEGGTEPTVEEAIQWFRTTFDRTLERHEKVTDEQGRVLPRIIVPNFIVIPHQGQVSTFQLMTGEPSDLDSIEESIRQLYMSDLYEMMIYADENPDAPIPPELAEYREERERQREERRKQGIVPYETPPIRKSKKNKNKKNNRRFDDGEE